MIDGVNHRKASLLAACSRRKAAEVMPSSGHGAATALPGAVALVAAAETQRGSGRPREKAEGDGMMTLAGLDLCCPSCCRGMVGSVCPMPVGRGR